MELPYFTNTHGFQARLNNNSDFNQEFSVNISPIKHANS
jgi:hypothetical protein